MGGGQTKAAAPAAKAPKAAKAASGKGKDRRKLLEEHLAAGHVKEVKEMLLKAPELLDESLDDHDSKPLQVACKNGHYEVADALLKLGANRDARDKSGATALMYAAGAGSEKICKLILDAGANIKIVDNDQNNALWYAQHNNKDKVEQLLQMYACEYTW
ncbi:ankyrin repeat-containing domain protein [Pelagophyceae sp. CCMP2097]|nr:ankyrin repeat-containing domain protein [Pelagophyceae sp. CCMP2097]|mmetsp:Transcript_6582/g.21251  ORF Transcript_6582/g.21251 Transcript_6582/m.21251 type:complete len:159 (-) Transcript_6582:59-535(-)